MPITVPRSTNHRGSPVRTIRHSNQIAMVQATTSIVGVVSMCPSASTVADVAVVQAVTIAAVRSPPISTHTAAPAATIAPATIAGTTRRPATVSPKRACDIRPANGVRGG